MEESPIPQKGLMAFQVLLLICSLVLFWEAFKIEGIGSISGSGIFPMAAAVVMAASLLVRLVADFRQSRQQRAEGKDASEGRFLTDVLPLLILAFIGVCIAFMVAMNFLGFWIPTAAFLGVTFFWLYTRNFWKVALVTAGAVAFIYLVFAFVFKVYLP